MFHLNYIKFLFKKSSVNELALSNYSSFNCYYSPSYFFFFFNLKYDYNWIKIFYFTIKDLDIEAYTFRNKLVWNRSKVCKFVYNSKSQSKDHWNFSAELSETKKKEKRKKENEMKINFVYHWTAISCLFIVLL